MGKIDYVDKTINYVTGCTKVSPACRNCYAEVMTKRLNAMGQEKYQYGFDVVIEHWKMLDFKFPKKPRRYFVNSMSDTFHNKVSDKFLTEMFMRITQNPQHTFVIVTKRARRMVEFLSDFWHHVTRQIPRIETPLQNAWFIVTAENQETFNKRVPSLLYLCNTFIPVRGISIEPMLGPIDLSSYIKYLDWVIVGGESGPNARPMHLDWVRSIRDQCQAANVPFWFKQWGEWKPGVEIKAKKEIIDYNGKRYECRTTEDIDKIAKEVESMDRIAYASKVGKKKAGDLLGGKQFKEIPT